LNGREKSIPDSSILKFLDNVLCGDWGFWKFGNGVADLIFITITILNNPFSVFVKQVFQFLFNVTEITFSFQNMYIFYMALYVLFV
jgi:hypothetical protein